MKFFKGVCKVANMAVCISMPVYPSAFLTIHPSICPSHATRNLMDKFTWHFTLRRLFSKICPENSHLVKIGQINKKFIWRTKYIQD